MKKQNEAGKPARLGERTRRIEPASHEMSDDQIRQALLSSSSPATLAGHLTDVRFLDTQRRQIAGQIGAVQGNTHLQRVATVQRALPNITEPAAPDIPGMAPADRTRLLGLVSAFHGARTVANGRAAVDAIAAALDPGSVQYNGQSDITHVSPQFRDAPSGDAVRASVQATGAAPTQQLGGYAFQIEAGPPARYQVEIYPEAFLRGTTPEEMLSYVAGVIIHEFIHVEQFRRQTGSHAGSERFSEANIELQAWLWQAEHVDELGIAPGSRGFNQIITHVRQYYGQMQAGDITASIRHRVARVLYRAIFYQCRRMVEMTLPPPQGAIDSLRDRFAALSPADRAERNADHQALLQSIQQLQQGAAAGGGT